jgi:aspartate kinase
MTPRPPVVLKFGGAALSDVQGILARIRAVQAEGAPVVLVASAREGVTDLLTRVLAHPRSRVEHGRILRRIEGRHPELPPAGRAQARRLARLVSLVEASYPADRPLGDRLLSMGERLSVHWLAQRLVEEGIPAAAVEADHLGIVTDNAYGASCILFDRSELAVRRGLRRILSSGRIPVVTGYFGRSLEGRVAVLGRGGSDYSASAIGAILGAARVELVKRYVPILTADPRHVVGARPIDHLSYEEAEELAQFGARVLHPLTIEPARQAGVELWVRSQEHPDVLTTIAATDSEHHTRAVTLLRPLRLLRLRVPGGRQRPGIVAEVSDRLSKARINVVALFTSSALLSLVLEPPHVRGALRALAPVTQDSAAVVEGPYSVALVTAIGDGILAELNRLPSEALVDARGFSATPRSLSLAVEARSGPSALRAVHHALVEQAAA